MRADGWRSRPQRIPFPTRTAVRAGLLVAALLAVAFPASAQVSPGPLSKAHRTLEGNRSCFQCHPSAGSKERMDDRCLACHGEIAALRSAKRGLHATATAQACAKCHPDHGGVDFDLIAFEEGAPERFDHTRAGYALEGVHARVACRDCHQPRNQRSAVMAKRRGTDRTRTWLGLETACAGCHGDPHRGQLAADCASCHDLTGWRPARRFDHAKSAYPLTGKHAALACAKCHTGADAPPESPAGTVAAARWKPLEHGECSPCHRDPHAGRFGAECAKCHTTDDFKRVNESGFDHSRTRYPLAGAHARVACASCHDPRRAWGAKPAFDRCDRCHRDAHAGQTARAGTPAPDCEACHRVAAFRPSTYGLAAHARTGFALAGAHARASCEGCHGKGAAATAKALGPARVPLHPAHALCTDCHGDPHAGRFSAGGERPRNEGCNTCHDVEHFTPSRIDARAHGSFGFALSGAHRAVPCAACHRELAGRTPAPGPRTLRAVKLAALAFKDTRRKCAECHETPHGTQFAARRDRGACEGCHDESAWKPVARFDHDRDARFRLEGAHARVRCAACHPRAKGTPNSPVVYRPVSSRCESCHVTTP